MMLCAVCCTYVVPKLHGEKVDVVCCVLYVVPKLHAEKVVAVCFVWCYCIAYTTAHIVPKLHGGKVDDAACCVLCCFAMQFWSTPATSTFSPCKVCSACVCNDSTQHTAHHITCFCHAVVNNVHSTQHQWNSVRSDSTRTAHSITFCAMQL